MGDILVVLIDESKSQSFTGKFDWAMVRHIRGMLFHLSESLPFDLLEETVLLNVFWTVDQISVSF